MKAKVAPDTIARTIILILALVNQLLAVFGKGTIQITENDIYQVVSLVWTIGSALVAWWYNNSFTKHAIRADNYLASLKNGSQEVE